jgi:hypothetical protein
MNPALTTSGEPIHPPLKVWWIVVGAFFASLVTLWALSGFLFPPVTVAAKNPLQHLIGLVPLFLSIIVRWLVLPRYAEPSKAFPMFVAGLALAEGCGLVGLFTGGPYRDDLFLLALLGVLQFMPVYVRRLGEQQQAGFRPDN